MTLVVVLRLSGAVIDRSSSERIDPIENADEPAWSLHIVEHTETGIFDSGVGDGGRQHSILGVDVHSTHDTADAHQLLFAVYCHFTTAFDTKIAVGKHFGHDHRDCAG